MSNRPRWIVALALLAGAGGVVTALRILPAADAGRASPPVAVSACLTTPAVGPGAAGRPGAFFKTQAHLDGQGTLVGRRLFVGVAGQATAADELPAESSFSGPVDGVVAIAADDGRHSTVQLVSAVGGCATTIFTSDSIVRLGVIDGVDGSLLLHLVARANRADLGIWQLTKGATQPTRILEPLPATLGFGVVWATDLRLDELGRNLAVQSCQDRECLTRIVDLGALARPAIVLRGSRQGPILGFSGDRLITWAACDGVPCAVLAWDAAAAAPTQLIADAEAAGLTRAGRLLVATFGDAPDHAVVIDLQTGTLRPLHGLAHGDRPVAAGGLAVAGLELGPDQLAVAQPAGDAHAIRPSAAGEVLP